MQEDKITEIPDEIAAWREAEDKMRGLLRWALRKGTRSDLQHGCLEALAVLDSVSPRGERVFTQGERDTFAPGNHG